MSVIEQATKSLCGLAFSIADLMLLDAWAQAGDLSMVVDLAHGPETEEYEEVLAFSPNSGALRRWVMWRNADTVYVQPLIGRLQTYSCVVAAIDALSVKPEDVLTDIHASWWPE